MTGSTRPRGCNREDPAGRCPLASLKFYGIIDQAIAPLNAEGAFSGFDPFAELLCHNHGLEAWRMMLHLGVIGVKIAARLLTFSWLAFSTYPSPVDLTTRAEALAAQASSSPIHGMRPNNQVSIINHAMINHE